MQFRLYFVKHVIQLIELKLVSKLTVLYVGYHSGTDLQLLILAD